MALQLEPGPPNSLRTLVLYEFDPVSSGWQQQTARSNDGPPTEYDFTPNPKMTGYETVSVGDQTPVNGVITYPEVTHPPTPSAPPFIPNVYLGWQDGGGAEFSPSLAWGSGIPCRSWCSPASP